GAICGKLFGTVKVRAEAIDGEYALINTHDLGELVSCDEVLVERIYDLSLVPFVPDLVVDCGSHIGLFSLIAGLKYPRAELIAYEPNPENFQLSRRQLDRFGSRIRLIEAAVSDQTGQSRFCALYSN